MPIRRGSRNVSTLMGGDLAIDIDHATDSITLGDETNKMILQDIGGVFTVPVKVLSTTTDAILTGGTARTKITDGVDNVEIDTVGAEKALKVSVISAIGGLAFSETDSAAWTATSSSFMPIGGVFDDVASDALAEGEMGTARMTSARALHVHIASQAGGTSGLTDTELRATAVPVSLASLPALAAGTNNIGDVDVASLPGTVATDITAIKTAVEILDNAISGTEMQVDVLTMPTVGVTGTFWQATQPVSGTFWQATQPVSIASLPALAAGTNNIGDVDILSIAAGDNNIGNVDIVTMPDAICVGKAAHDAAVSGNPIRIAGRARLAEGTAVAEDDTVDLACDNQGRVITTPHTSRDLVIQANGVQSNTTEATMLAAGAAGVFHDITKIILTNSNTTTSCRVQIRDATAGTIMLEVNVAANGGAVIDFGNVPMKQTTAANNWTIDQQSTVADIYYFVQAVKRIA